MKQLLLLFTVFTFSLSAIAQTTNPAIDSAEAKHQKNPRNDALRQRFHQPDYQNNSNTNTVEKRGRRLTNHQFFLELQNVKGLHPAASEWPQRDWQSNIRLHLRRFIIFAMLLVLMQGWIWQSFAIPDAQTRKTMILSLMHCPTYKRLIC